MPADAIMRRIAEAVDAAHRTPEQIAENVEWLRKRYDELCALLQDCVQRHELGLGGERIDRLVVESFERYAAILRHPGFFCVEKGSRAVRPGESTTEWSIGVCVDPDAARVEWFYGATFESAAECCTRAIAAAGESEGEAGQ